jgi:hypothetical protein
VLNDSITLILLPNLYLPGRLLILPGVSIFYWLKTIDTTTKQIAASCFTAMRGHHRHQFQDFRIVATMRIRLASDSIVNPPAVCAG